MALLTVGPTDASEDEERIGDHYRSAYKELLGYGIPLFGITYFLDLKWVIAYGFMASIYTLVTIEARLHDLAIRSRRATILLGRERQNSN